ncbi:unnamed protein product [Sphenostylis stenocarpa]|uniref:Uncharacterized protein n=1 Tax=Sphenostylis stenocarpa TaxID=92480 RepID=A0AA87B8W9_9FABA|nr:unnamed protein product [Sphenostylis stenocarpa]
MVTWSEESSKYSCCSRFRYTSIEASFKSFLAAEKNTREEEREWVESNGGPALTTTLASECVEEKGEPLDLPSSSHDTCRYDVSRTWGTLGPTSLVQPRYSLVRFKIPNVASSQPLFLFRQYARINPRGAVMKGSKGDVCRKQKRLLR